MSNTDGWTGTAVTNARTYVANTMLPGPCHQCGQLVDSTMPWNIGHIQPRWKRPDLALEPSNWAPEHRKCSDRTGRREQRNSQLAKAAEKKRRTALGPVKGLTPRFPGDPPTGTSPVSESLPLTPEAELFDPDSIRDVPWLADLVDIPDDAAWPRFMTPPHPDAVGSLGAEVEDWLRVNQGVEWRWWLKLATRRQLEVDAAGRLVWPTVVESCSRRVGKSTRMRGLALWRMAQRERFGEPQLVIHTGSDLAICRAVQQRAWEWAEGEGWHVTRGNGKEALETQWGDRWLVRSQAGVYGWDTTLGLVDEGWDVPSGVVDEGLEPSLMEREQSQLVLTSTAHRRATSLMRRRIADGLAGMGSQWSTLLLLWGAGPADDVSDPAVWRRSSAYWSPSRARMIGDLYARAVRGDADPSADDPDPMEGFKAQYLNVWPALSAGRAPRGDVVVTDREWSGLEGSVPAGPPAVVAVESWYSEGVAVASCWRLDAGRVLVGVESFGSVPAAAAAAVSAGAGVVLVGKTLVSDPLFTGVRGVEAVGSRMAATVTDLRWLVDNDVLRHDGSKVLGGQVAELRTQRGPEGPRVVSHGRGDAVKAAVWAATRARQTRAMAAVY